MPIRRLTAFVEALPHVTASASFRRAEEVAVGTGALQKGARRSTTDRWKRALRRGVRRRPVQARTPEAVASAAQAAGIRFVRVVPVSEGTPRKRGRRPSTEP